MREDRSPKGRDPYPRVRDPSRSARESPVRRSRTLYCLKLATYQHATFCTARRAYGRRGGGRVAWRDGREVLFQRFVSGTSRAGSICQSCASPACTKSK